MEVVGARHVGQHAVVRRGDKRDAEVLQRRQDRAAVFELPPAFDRPVLVDTADHDLRAFGDQEPRRELRARGDMDLAGGHIDKLIERHRNDGLIEDSGAPVTMIDERHDERDASARRSRLVRGALSKPSPPTSRIRATNRPD